MATVNPSSILALALCGYADQLDEIRSSLSAMAQESGEHKQIVDRMATKVDSASNVLRAASHVINSTEIQKEHETNKAARAEAKARRAGR